MTELDKISRYLADVLMRGGVAAVTAWPGGPAPRVDEAVAAVSLRACAAVQGGFRDYLGERFDAETGRWQELYGRKLKVAFGLDIYAGRSQGEAGCQAAFHRMAEVLQSVEGLKLLSLERGAVRFDQTLDLYCCPVEAACQAWLYAVADEGGAFLDFMVRGDVNEADGT